MTDGTTNVVSNNVIDNSVVSSNVENMEVSTNLLPKIKTSELLDSPMVKNIISTEISKNESRGKELASFLSDAITKIFDESNKQDTQIQEIFDTVLDLKGLKESTIRILESYENSNSNTAVKTSIRKIEEEITGMRPILVSAKNALEETSGFFSRAKEKIFGDKSLELAKNAMSGIKGKILNLDSIYVEARNTVKLDQMNLKENVPNVAYRITKMEALMNAFDIVLQNENNELLRNMRDQLLKNIVVQKTYLKQCMIMTGITTTSGFRITSSEFDLHSRLMPLVLMNNVSSNAKGIRAMEGKVDAGLKMLEQSVMDDINEIHQMDLDYKIKAKTDIDNALSVLDNLILNEKKQAENIAIAEKLLDESLPTIKEKIKNLDNETIESVKKLDMYQTKTNEVLGGLKSLEESKI